MRTLFRRRGVGDRQLLEFGVVGVRTEAGTVGEQLAQRRIADAEDVARSGVPIQPTRFDRQ